MARSTIRIIGKRTDKGGGARGIAHLGAIEALLDAGFRVERLVVGDVEWFDCSSPRHLIELERAAAVESLETLTTACCAH